MEIMPRIEVPKWVLKKMSAENNTEIWKWVNEKVAKATDPDVVFGKEEDCDVS